MTNKNTTLLIGTMLIVTSWFSNSGVYLICGSIFFSANCIIDEMQKLAGKKDKTEEKCG